MQRSLNQLGVASTFLLFERGHYSGVAWVNKLKRRDGATANNSADPPTVYGKEDAGDGRTPAFNNK